MAMPRKTADVVARALAYQARSWTEVKDAGRKAGEPVNEIRIMFTNGQVFRAVLTEEENPYIERRKQQEDG